MTRLRLLDATRTGRPGAGLERKLHHMIVGQDEAIHHIVRAYQCYLTGLAAAGSPVANLLFLGPTGTSKTRAVEATAEALLGDPRAVIKIDCAEFQHSHEIAKLIGSPPGYLGHRETHALLSQEMVNQYHTDKVKISFVLFDEIEKASGRAEVEDAVMKRRQKYYPLFRQVLSGKSTALFSQMDWRLGLIMELQLASQTPLIQP